MTKQRINTIKRYVISTLITFTSGFLIAIVPFIDQLTIDDLESGVLVGILLAALRAGIKAILEATATGLQK